MARERTVTLRPIESRDLPLTLKWRNHPKSRRWFFHQEEITLEDHRRWFAKLKAKENDRFFMVEDESGTPVGTVSIYDIDPEARRAEYGRMLIDPERRGEGLAAAATVQVLRWAFEGLPVDVITLEVMSDNAPARKLYRSLGFTPTGRRIRQVDEDALEVITMEIRRESIDKGQP